MSTQTPPETKAASELPEHASVPKPPSEKISTARSAKDLIVTKEKPITEEWASEALMAIGVPSATATELAPKLAEVVGQEIRRKFGRTKLIKFARRAFAAALK